MCVMAPRPGQTARRVRAREGLGHAVSEGPGHLTIEEVVHGPMLTRECHTDFARSLHRFGLASTMSTLPTMFTMPSTFMSFPLSAVSLPKV